jgi:hypothetical protein
LIGEKVKKAMQQLEINQVYNGGNATQMPPTQNYSDRISAD